VEVGRAPVKTAIGQDLRVRLPRMLDAPMPTTDWNAASYDRVADPQARWGAEVLMRLPLAGDERVLDAGCGTGRVTQLLLTRVPRGEVVALDASAAMLEEARRRLASQGDRVSYVHADLGQPLPIDGPVDAILSTATFHWIADHDALFRSLRGVLRDGGRFVAQCGGAGNVESVHGAAAEAGRLDPFAAHFAGWQGPWNFARPEDTERRLTAAGFGDVRCWLAERPVTPEDPREFLRTIVLGAHLDRLPADQHDAFLDAVLARLGERPTIDYVRLNIDATAA
jgi:trans-aconitate 2-methyltransferase